MSPFPTAIKLKGNTTQLNLSTVATLWMEIRVASEDILKPGSHMLAKYVTWLPILPAILLRHMRTHRQQQETSQVFTTCIPAKSNFSQLRRHANGEDWHGLCYQHLLFSHQNSVAGSTGSYVTGSLVAYENQALLQSEHRSVGGWSFFGHHRTPK